MKNALALVAVAALFSLAVSAQTRRPRRPAPAPASPATERAAWPLESLRVEGNRSYSAEQIIQIAGLRAGQIAGKADFDAARARLIATGAFDSVGYRFAPAKNGNGYDATLEVAEVAQVYPLRFEDLPATDAEIRAYLKQQDPLFGARIPATQPALDRYSAWISAFLAQRNFHDPIAGRLAPDVPPELVIVFRPAQARPSVAYVKFSGAGEIPAEELQKQFYGVAIGSTYSEPAFRTLLETTIRPLYEARGRIRVSFPKIETAPAPDVKGVTVTVQVNQGDPYKLGTVAFAGARPPGEKFEKLAKLEPGAVVNFDQVRAAQKSIERSFARNGYLEASSVVKRDLHEASKTVDLTFEITPGPQFTLGKLEIVGLDITTEPAIRKLWGIAPGKPFNADYPAHFVERVKEEGIFDDLHDASAETTLHRETATVDVTLRFK